MNEQVAAKLAAQFTQRWPDRIQVQVDTSAVRGTDGYVLRLVIPRENRCLRLTRETQVRGIWDVCTTLLEKPGTVGATTLLPQRGTDLSPEDIAAIRACYGTAEQRKRCPNLLSSKQLARAYHVGWAKIQKIIHTQKEDTMEEKAKEDEQETNEASSHGGELKTLYTEEEAAAFLGVKVQTIRAYAAGDILQLQQSEGMSGFLLADLERYKQSRRLRGIRQSADETMKRVPSAPAASPSPGEVQLLQSLVTYAFVAIPGITGLRRMAEVPRTWKLDVTTTRGPETYRVTQSPDGSFRQERW